MTPWPTNLKPAEPSEEFLKNEERRRLMIIEAARMRREKEKRLQEQAEEERLKQKEALERHRIEKKELIAKYLRGPPPSVHNNLHDKYERIKREKNDNEEPLELKKWGKRGVSETKNRPTSLNSVDNTHNRPSFQQIVKTENINPINNKKKIDCNQLDQENNLDELSIPPPKLPPNPARQSLEKEFLRDWDDLPIEEEILKISEDEEINMETSKFLDSLDLDYATVKRTKEVNRLMTKKESKVDEIRALIGYESNVFGDANKDENKLNSKKEKQPIAKRENEEMTKNKQQKSNNNMPNRQKQGPRNEVELLNELKRKPEAEILNWAAPADASDLFSNYSSKSKKSSHILDQLNRDIRTAKTKGETTSLINEHNVKTDMNFKKSGSRERPIINPTILSEKNISKELPPQNPFKKKQTVEENSRASAIQKSNETNEKRSTSKNNPRWNSNNTNDYGNRNHVPHSEYENPVALRANSNKKPSKRTISQEKINNEAAASSYLKTNLRIHAAIPAPPRSEISTATLDQNFEVAEFIKNELLELNEAEQLLQKELRLFHMANKDHIKNMNEKHSIKTDYKHSAELQNDDAVTPIYNNVPQTEDDLEESLQRLDNMLIRRNLAQEEETNNISLDSKPSVDPQKLLMKLADNVNLNFGINHKEGLQDGYAAKNSKTKSQSSAVEKSNQMSMTEGNSQITKNSTQGYKLPPTKKEQHKTIIKPKETEIDVSVSQEIDTQSKKCDNIKNNTNEDSFRPLMGLPQVLQLNGDTLEDSLDYNHNFAPEPQPTHNITVNERLKKMLLE